MSHKPSSRDSTYFWSAFHHPSFTTRTCKRRWRLSHLIGASSGLEMMPTQKVGVTCALHPENTCCELQKGVSQDGLEPHKCPTSEVNLEKSCCFQPLNYIHPSCSVGSLLLSTTGCHSLISVAVYTNSTTGLQKVPKYIRH